MTAPDPPAVEDIEPAAQAPVTLGFAEAGPWPWPMPHPARLAARFGISPR